MKKTELGRDVQSVIRAVKILEFIAKNGNLAGVSDISRAVDLSKSTVHGLVSTLHREGYLHQGLHDKYSLGLKLFELGQVVLHDMDLRKIAAPFLSALANKTNETIHLGVLSGTDVIYIDKIDSEHKVTVITRTGGRIPAHYVGIGKSLLAGLPEETLDELYAGKQLSKSTEKSITDLAELKAHLRIVSEQGYSMDMEEYVDDLRCVGAPIKNHLGKVIAACSVCGPSYRLADCVLSELMRDVKETADKISQRLGYSG